MPDCLIALGANLGERAQTLDRAVAAVADLPHTQLVARSAWHETAPVGGPSGQTAFLNGAVRVATAIPPLDLFDSLLAIEAALGRVRDRRWEARALDLDLLLYDAVVLDEPRLRLPHPRMECRRFVLEPAAEVAPWMIHPTSGWTVARLRGQLDRGAEVVAVAAETDAAASELARQVADMSGRPFANNDFPVVLERGELFVAPWSAELEQALPCRPKLILAASPAGTDAALCRKILKLPLWGPVTWLPPSDDKLTLPDAVAAVQAVWPNAAGSRREP